MFLPENLSTKKSFRLFEKFCFFSVIIFLTEKHFKPKIVCFGNSTFSLRKKSVFLMEICFFPVNVVFPRKTFPQKKV